MSMYGEAWIPIFLKNINKQSWLPVTMKWKAEKKQDSDKVSHIHRIGGEKLFIRIKPAGADAKDVTAYCEILLECQYRKN